MKYIFKLIIILVSFSIAQGQNPDLENKITLAVVLPDNSEHLSNAQISKIASKMQKMVTNYGISGEGYTNNFVIYPKYEIHDKNIVEGMRNVNIIDVEFGLFIKELNSGKVYASYSQTLKGDGYSYDQAVNQSISKISTYNEKLEVFFEDAKLKIIGYYTENCNQIYNNGDSLIRQKRFSEAIALLYTVPSEVGECYEKIRSKQDEAYLAYQDQQCQENIQKVKSLIADKKYSTALNILGAVDPTSSCAQSAEKLINEIALKIDEKDKQLFQQQEQLRKDDKEMEILRMKNIRQIAEAYYKSKPSTVIYKSLF